MTGDSEDITDCNPDSGNCRGAAGQSNNVRYQDFGVPRNTLIAASKGGSSFGKAPTMLSPFQLSPQILRFQVGIAL